MLILLPKASLNPQNPPNPQERNELQLKIILLSGV